MLNVQTLGILLRALRDGNTRPDALRAPSAVNGVARVSSVASDPNESLRGDAAVRSLPVLLRPATTLAADGRHAPFDGSPRAPAHATVDARAGRDEPHAAPREALTAAHEARGASHEARIALREARLAGAPASATTTAHALDSGSHSSASAALEISAMGRWLTGVPHRLSEGATAAVRATPPLVTDGMTPTPALAQALEHALATSGVFYEAHLARWIADDFTQAQLAHEPQAAWTSTTTPDAANVSAPALPQDAEKLAVVARQLEALDTRTVVWSGLPWPGQHATIEIGEDERGGQRDDAHDASAQPAWRTRITLTLPTLGTVEAVLSLRGDAIDLRLVAPEAAQNRLAAARDKLRAALAARSLELAAFSTGSDDGR